MEQESFYQLTLMQSKNSGMFVSDIFNDNLIVLFANHGKDKIITFIVFSVEAIFMLMSM